MARVRVVEWEDHGTACLAVRREVFIEEQGVPPGVEIDGKDPSCVHVLAETSRGEPVGTARLLPEGRIGRIAVRGPWRGRGIASAMLTLLEDEAKREGIGRVILHAQESALALYRRAGYRDAGEPFLEAGIRHRPLVKDLQVG